jgi:hypothetical protein
MQTNTETVKETVDNGKQPRELTMILLALEGMYIYDGISLLTFVLGKLLASSVKNGLTEEEVNQVLEETKGSIQLSFLIHNDVSKEELSDFVAEQKAKKA